MGYQFTAFLKLSIYAIPHLVGAVLCIVYVTRWRTPEGGMMLVGSALALISRLAHYIAISFFIRSLAANINLTTQLTKSCQYGEVAGYSLFWIGFAVMLWRRSQQDVARVRRSPAPSNDR